VTPIYFTNFVVVLGATLTAMVMFVWWTLRLADVSTWRKITLPVMLIGIGLYVPYTVSGMMGMPVTVTDYRVLPAEFKLLMYHPVAGDAVVDLWVVTDGGIPRAYEVPLTKELKDILMGDVTKKLDEGVPVFLSFIRMPNGTPKYSFSPNTFGDLPEKRHSD